MKRRATALLLAACLIFGGLAGCKSASVLEDYDALYARMEAVDSGSFVLDYKVEFGTAIPDLPEEDLHAALSGTFSNERGELEADLVIYGDGGARRVTTTVRTDGVIYTDQTALTAYVLDLEGAAELLDGTVEEILGGDVYLTSEADGDEAPLNNQDPARSAGLDEELLEDNLTEEEGVYTLSLEGADASVMVDKLLADMAEDGGLADIVQILAMRGDELTGDMLDEIAGLAADGEYEGYAYSLSLAYDEGTETYTETLTCTLPDIMTVAVSSTVTEGEIDPISAPELTMDEETISARLNDAVIVEASESGGAAEIVDGEAEIDDGTGEGGSIDGDGASDIVTMAEDGAFPEFQLYGFTSVDGAGLKITALEGDDGDTYTVLTFADGDNWEFTYMVDSELEYLYIYYFLDDGYSAATEVLLDAADSILYGMMSEDGAMNGRISPLYTGDDDSWGVVAFSMSMDDEDGEFIYLVQRIPGTDLFLVGVIGYLVSDMSDEERGVLADLTAAMGLDTDMLFGEMETLS